MSHPIKNITISYHNWLWGTEENNSQNDEFTIMEMQHAYKHVTPETTPHVWTLERTKY